MEVIPDIINLSLLWESPAVTVWVAPLDVSPAVLGELQSTLSADEQKRARGYGQKKLRDTFTVRRGILRVLLGRQMSCSPRDVQISHAPFGKPILTSGAAHFNVSSSHGVAVWAFSSLYPVGVDIERIDDTPPSATLIADTFSPAEQAVLIDAPGRVERQANFFRGWTGKEACAKAAGFGLSLPLTQYEVLLGNRGNSGIDSTPITTPFGDFVVAFLQTACPPEKRYGIALALLRAVR